MSFVGLITRKDKPTGVSLMAKVVTANKKKSAKKVFKVSVKANALDDFSCCVLDHGTAVDKINAQDITKVTEDVSLTYSGINDTSISYRIIDIGVPYLSTYLGEDGKVLGRPVYGLGDANGYIEITVTKGDAVVVSRIQTAVKEVTASEVLADATFTEAALWTMIKGNNDAYPTGLNNVRSQLTLLTSKSVPSMSQEPVTIEWSVDDQTLSYTDIYSEPRINASTGMISKPSYKDACSLVGMISGINIEVDGSTTNALQNYVRIGGITLTATLRLGEATKPIVYKCSTFSKYLTNQEIMDVILANIYINTQDGKIAYKEVSDASFHTITAPASGGTYTFTAFGNTGSELFEAPALKLGAGEIIGVSITSTVLDFNGSNEYSDAGLLVSAFNGGFQAEESGAHSNLVVDLDALAAADTSKREFAIGATISVSGYSSTGETLSGSALNIKRHAQIKVNTSAIAS